MEPAFETNVITVYQGDALAVLRELPADLVDCVVTSPPYWGLRDYGIGGQVGLEASPDEYVRVMTAVFGELRRVLRPHGTLWLNMGDSYATRGGSPTTGSFDGGVGRGDRPANAPNRGKRQPRGEGRWGGGDHSAPELKSKDMMGIPWRLAFALQADGWYLRSDIIWSKPNPMPESVTDRPTRSHEYVFLFSKQERYFYDADAIREPLAESSIARLGQSTFWEQTGGPKDFAHGINPNRSARGAVENLARRYRSGNKVRRLEVPTNPNDHIGKSVPWEDEGDGRNARSVWEIATQPYPDAHFATFPEELPRRCIKAGSPAEVCRSCGRPRTRVVLVSGGTIGKAWHNHENDLGRGQRGGDNGSNFAAEGYKTYRREQGGFTDCGHGAYTPGVVLDPFAGSGTTLAVARDLGRRAIGIEINPQYVRLIGKRCAQLALELA